MSDLLAKVHEIRPVLLVLDNATPMFVGDPNVSPYVQQFINLLHRLADEGGTTCNDNS